MKKKNLLIIGILLITITFFGIKNYNSFAPTKVYNSTPKEYKPLIETKRISNPKQTTPKKTLSKQITPKPTSSAILKFKSSNFDYEDVTDILFTKHETSYHTLNFNNNTITLKSKLGTNEWKTLVYKWKGFNDPYGNGYIEFEIINDGTIYQVWRSALNNFGYEMKNGTKYVFYDVKQIN